MYYSNNSIIIHLILYIRQTRPILHISSLILVIDGGHHAPPTEDIYISLAFAELIQFAYFATFHFLLISGVLRYFISQASLSS